MAYIRSSVFGLLTLTFAASAFAQAPASAQVWEVRYLVDRYAVDSGGNEILIAPDNPYATRVDVTIQGRVGIRPNSSSTGTSNAGVGRLGGGQGSGFRFEIRDAVSEAANLNQGSLARGLTGESRTLDANGFFDPGGTPTLLRDPAGQPLAGLFAPFRGGLNNANTSPIGVGRNDDDLANGLLANPVIGRPTAANVVGLRTIFLGADGTSASPLGAAQVDAAGNIISGDFVSYFRLSYFPRPGEARTINFNAINMNARYLTSINGTFGVPAPIRNIGNSGTSFQVPGPSGAALLIPALAALSRRRR